jgi:hypothetical protein
VKQAAVNAITTENFSKLFFIARFILKESRKQNASGIGVNQQSIHCGLREKRTEVALGARESVPGLN